MRISDWSSDVCSSDLIARKMRRTNDESYTIPENQFLAWRRSGDARYKAIGEQFLMDDSFFDPLAADQNVLPGLHAYSHVNALCSGVQAYLSLGDEKYLTAVTNAFRMRSEEHTSELQSLMRISYAVFCLKKKTTTNTK